MRTFVHRQPAPTVLAPPAGGATQQPAPKDPKTDAPSAWTHLQAFGDSELNKQPGSFYQEANANDFFKDWTPYFRAPDRVVAYLAAIRKVNIPAKYTCTNPPPRGWRSGVALRDWPEVDCSTSA
jgi:hypothetical protein